MHCPGPAFRSSAEEEARDPGECVRLPGPAQSAGSYSGGRTSSCPLVQWPQGGAELTSAPGLSMEQKKQKMAGNAQEGVARGFRSTRGDERVEGMLSPGVCGSSQLVPVVGMMCGVIQTAAAVLAKTLREGAAKD